MSTTLEQTAGRPDTASAVAAKPALSLPAVKPNAYIGTLGVFLGAGLATLNGRLISVGLPDLRGALGLGFDQASWIPTAYNMALMFMGPFSVYLGGLLGVRRVLLPSAAIFVICSLLLPFSHNLGVMLALQVISGLASGTFYPLTLSYALRSLPIRFVIYGIGVYSIDILGVTSLAVPLEGWFMEHLSWYWIFWFSALLTPLMMLCIYRAIPNPPKRSGLKPKLSWHGFLYFSLGLSLIYGVLDQGERLDWLNSGVIVGMLMSAAFLLVMTLVRRLIAPNPLVNPKFLASRNTLLTAACLFAFRFTILTVALLIPGYLGAIQGYRPEETGRVLLWIIPPQLVFGLLAARLMRRFDGRVILALGFFIVALAGLMITRLTSAWIGANFLIPILVLAAGLSIAFVGLVGSIVQQALTAVADTEAAAQPINILTFSAFIHIVRILGGEAGTAMVQRLLSVREQFHSNMIGLYVDSGNWLADDRLRALTGALFSKSASLEEAQGRAVLVLGSQVKLQAYTLAYIDGFMAIAIVSALALVLIACMQRMKIYFDFDLSGAGKLSRRLHALKSQ